MSISCAHPRPALNLPGFTPGVLSWSPPAFLSDDPENQKRQILDALQAIFEQMKKQAARRTIVPLQDATLQLRDGQIVQGVADGQTLIMPQPVANGDIGHITILLDAVKTPLTVVHPDGTTDTLREKGLYDYALGQTDQSWVTPPGATGGIRAVSAGTQFASTGTISFANSNGVTFGLSGSSRLTASVAAIGLSQISLATLANSSIFTAATDSVFAGSNLVLALQDNASSVAQSLANVQFRLSSNTLFGAAYIRFLATNSNQQGQYVSFKDGGGVTWGMDQTTFANFGLIPQIKIVSLNAISNIKVSAGASSANLSAFTLSNSNGVSFGLNGSTITAAVSAPTLSWVDVAGTTTFTQSPTATLRFANNNFAAINVATFASRWDFDVIPLLQVSAGTTFLGGSNTAAPLGTISFANANGISFGAQVAGRFLTVTGSVATSLTAINVSAGTTSTNLSALTFANANNVSFGLNGSTITASASVASSLTAINVSAGTTSNNLSALVFANANGISFGLNGSTVTASHATSLTAVNVSAGTTSQNLSALTFANANGVTFGLNGSVVTASVGAGGAAGSISAGTTSVALGQVVFGNANNFSFGLAGSTVTGSYTVPTVPVALQHVEAGVSAINNSSALSFKDQNNLSFGLATAGGQMILTGQPFFNVTGANGSSVNATVLAFTAGVNNVGFAVSTNASGATVRAAASISVTAGTTNGALSQMSFANSNGVSFGLNGSTITASVAAAAGGNITFSAGTTNTGTNAFSFDDGGGVAFGLTGRTISASANQTIRVDATNVDMSGSILAFNNQFDGISMSYQSLAGRLIIAPHFDIANAFPRRSYWWNGIHPFVGGEANAVAPFNVSIMHLFPLGGIDGRDAPIGMSIKSLGLAFSGPSQTNTVAMGVTVQGGLYTAANATQLSLLNSFSSTFSQAAGATAGNSALLNGDRFFPISTANWSSNPVVPADSQAWMGIRVSVSGISNALQGRYFPIFLRGFGANGFMGLVGQSAGTASQATMLPSPFWGAVSTGGIPASLAASQMLGKASNATSLSTGLWLQAFGSTPLVAFAQNFGLTN